MRMKAAAYSYWICGFSYIDLYVDTVKCLAFGMGYMYNKLPENSSCNLLRDILQ